MGPRPGAVWYADPSSSLRLLISRDEDLRQDSLPELCDPPKDRDAEQLARVGAKRISRSMVRLDGLSFCRAETISKTAVTLHHLGVVEGRAFVIVFFFDDAERSASSAAIKAVLTSFRYRPTVDGSRCNPAAERAMCFDDKHMAVCREGRWKFTDCEQACATHGGPGEGCMFMSDQNRYACLCGQVAPESR
jgi:hypothetical protein